MVSKNLIKKKKQGNLKSTKNAARLDNNKAIDFLDRGFDNYQSKKYVEALIDFNEAIRLRDKPKAFYFSYRGRVYLKLEKYAEALIDFNEAIRLNNKSDANDFFSRGTVYIRLKKYAEALADFNEAIRLNNKPDANDFYCRGRVYLELEKYVEALADFNEAIRLRDKPGASDFFARGRVYLELEKYAEALADFNEAIRLNNKPDANDFYCRGRVYLELEKYAEALADFNQAISLTSKPEASYFFYRCRIYLELEKYAEALADFNQVICLNNKPDASEFLYRGRIYFGLKKYDEALADCNQAIHLDKEPNTSNFFARGRTYLELEKYAEALADFNEAIRLNNKPDANDFFYRGRSHFELKKYDEALADFNQACTLAPNTASFFCIRSVYHASQNDFLKAMTDLAKALVLDSNVLLKQDNSLSIPRFVTAHLNVLPLLNTAAKAGIVSVFSTLLCQGVKPDYATYSEATKEIKAILNYRPGRKQESIFTYCIRPDSDVARIQRLLLDQLDTSSASSSSFEAESDEEEFWSQTDSDSYQAQQEKRIKAFNKELKQKGINGIDWSLYKDLVVPAYRGVHWSPEYYIKYKRRAHRKENEVNQPAVSFATLKKAGQENALTLDLKASVFKKAHSDNLGFFKRLKETEDQPEKRTTNRISPHGKGKLFDNRFARFLQTYLNNYDNLINKGDIKTEYGFDILANPCVSTSCKAAIGAKYASGYLRFGDNPKLVLNPHYRRSTGKAKHPHLGVVYVYLIDLEFIKKQGTQILDMYHTQGKICPNDLYTHDQEILFESLLPGKYQVLRKTFTLPAFTNEHNALLSRGFPKNHIYKEVRQRVLARGKQMTLEDMKLLLGEGKEKNGYLYVWSKQLEEQTNVLCSGRESGDIFTVYPFINHQLTKVVEPVKRWKEMANKTKSIPQKKSPPAKEKRVLFSTGSEDTMQDDDIEELSDRLNQSSLKRR